MIETPLRRQLGDQHGEPVELGRRQARGRLVHGDDLGVLHQGAGDLDDLALRDLERADRGRRIDVGIERRKRLRRPPAPARGGRRAGRRRVFSGRPRNMFCATVSSGTCCSSWWIIAIPALAGGDRAVAGKPHAVDLDMALRGLEDAGQDVQQRRLAGAVLAEQPMNRAPLHRHVDAVERAHRAEALADVDQPQAIARSRSSMVPPFRTVQAAGPAPVAGPAARRYSAGCASSTLRSSSPLTA